MSPCSKIHINVAAYHEAGHALAALREGRQVALVYAFHQHPGNGACFYASKPSNPHDIAFNLGTTKAAWEHTMKTTCADIRITLAGPLSEAKALGKPLRSLGGISDLEKCIDRIARLKMLGSYISHYTDFEPLIAENILSHEARKVRHWIAHPKVWGVIIQIAETLSLKGKLDGVDIEELIGAVSSPNLQATLDFSGKPIQRKTLKTSIPPDPFKLPWGWVNNQDSKPLSRSFLQNSVTISDSLATNQGFSSILLPWPQVQPAVRP